MPALASALSEKYFGVAKLAKSFGHSKLPKVLATFATDGIPKSLFDDAVVPCRMGIQGSLRTSVRPERMQQQDQQNVCGSSPALILFIM